MAQTEVSIPSETETNTDEKKGLPKRCETLTYILKSLRPEEIFIAVIVVAIAFLAITPIIVIPVLPPMLALYYIALIVQVFRSDVDNQVGRFLGSVAKWLWVFFAVISVDLLLCMLIFGVTPSLKHRTFHGLSITRWIGVLTIICVFLTHSMLVRYYLGYRRHRRLEQNEEKVHLHEGIIGAINSLFYLLALFSIIRVAPLLKEHTILGHPTQKWVRVITLVVLGHFAVRILTSSIVVLFCLLKSIKAVKALTEKSSSLVWTKYIIYYAEGLRWSFNHFLTSLLVLLTWILYFGSRLNLSSSHIVRVVYDNGFWTAFCILVSALALLVKRGIFLTWEARVVYGRFCAPTLLAAKRLYLTHIIDVADPVVYGPRVGDIVREDFKREEEDRAAELEIYDHLPCAYDTMIMTKYLLAAEPEFSKAGYVPKVVQKWRDANSKSKIPPEPSLNRDDRELLKSLLKKDGLDIEHPEKWVVKYLNQCVDHVRILGGELEWVHCLNNIMTAVLNVAIIIVWLFLTGIATTKVVVLIASPILVASFIFGESCKNSFQGIMFTYVKRPFEVGEICTINDTQVKILRIGIRRTICSRVEGTADEVIYPNTMLATVPIVKHNGKLDSEQDAKQGSDYMELRLNSATKMERIEQLISKIETYLGDNQDGFKEHPRGVLTKNKGKTLIIKVHFECDMSTIGSLCNQSEKWRHFLSRMMILLDELDIQESTDACPIT